MILGRDVHRVNLLETELAAKAAELQTLQHIVQAQQETIRRQQDAVDRANERYAGLVQTTLANQRQTIQLGNELFADRGDTFPAEKAEWLTPPDLYAAPEAK